MIKKAVLPFIFLIFVLVSAHAADIRTLRCKNSLANYLHRLESGSDEALEIFEFRHKKDVRDIFGDQSLRISPVPMMREIFGIYRRPVIARGAKSLFVETRLIQNAPDTEFIKSLKPNTFYTYIIDDEKITFAHTRPGKMRDFGSKHAILRDQKQDIRLAGEFWVDDKGVFHFDGSSGTFQPKNTETANGLAFFRDQLGIKNAQVHYFDPSLVPAKEIVQPVRPGFALARVGSKFLSTTVRYSTVEKAVAYDIRESNDKIIALKDENGKEVTFRIEKGDSITTKETLFDTKDMALHKKKTELRAVASLDEKSEAVKLARQSGLNSKPILPQVTEEQTYTSYYAYPVINGRIDKSAPAFGMNVNEISYLGLSGSLKGKKISRFEARVEGNEFMVNQLQDHYKMQSLQNANRVSAIDTLKAVP